MVTPRTRTMSTYEPKGLAGRFGQVSDDYSALSSKTTISDFVGPGDCDPLTIDSWSMEGGRMNKPNSNFFEGWFSNYRADMLDNISQFNHLSFTDDLPTDVAFATEAAARTNPSRPSVGAVTNILELGDIVHLIKDTGSSLLRHADQLYRDVAIRDLPRMIRNSAKAGGDAWLGGLFGVAPLVRDLQAIHNFHDTFVSRVKEVKRMQSKNGLRRTIDLDSYTTSANSSKVLNSTWGGFVPVTFGIVTNLKVRAHCRWYPDLGRFNEAMINDDMARRLRNAITGLDLNLSSFWDGLPWSWLINWCYMVGQYQRATLNIVPCYLQGVHIMRHLTTTWSTMGPIQSTPELSVSEVKVVLESKTRKPSYVFPEAHFPLLSGSDMGILASLATKRL